MASQRPGSAAAVSPEKTGGPPGQACRKVPEFEPRVAPGSAGHRDKAPAKPGAGAVRARRHPLMRRSTARSAGYWRTAVVMAA